MIPETNIDKAHGRGGVRADVLTVTEDTTLAAIADLAHDRRLTHLQRKLDPEAARRSQRRAASAAQMIAVFVRQEAAGVRAQRMALRAARAAGLPQNIKAGRETGSKRRSRQRRGKISRGARATAKGRRDR